MKYLLGKVFEKLGHFMIRTAAPLLMTEHQRIKMRFLHDEDIKNLREVYDLNQHSIVVDVGGYKGDWASDIYSRYRCAVHIFEPIQKYVEILTERFKNNPDIIIYPFGLSNSDGEANFSLLNDGTSQFRQAEDVEKVKLVQASKFFTSIGLTHIDLIKINIEGGEYPLLQDLINSQMINDIINMQIQFHEINRNSQLEVNKLRVLLAKTHKPTYQYDFVWENWTKI